MLVVAREAVFICSVFFVGIGLCRRSFFVVEFLRFLASFLGGIGFF